MSTSWLQSCGVIPGLLSENALLLCCEKSLDLDVLRDELIGKPFALRLRREFPDFDLKPTMSFPRLFDKLMKKSYSCLSLAVKCARRNGLSFEPLLTGMLDGEPEDYPKACTRFCRFVYAQLRAKIAAGKGVRSLVLSFLGLLAAQHESTTSGCLHRCHDCADVVDLMLRKFKLARCDVRKLVSFVVQHCSLRRFLRTLGELSRYCLDIGEEEDSQSDDEDSDSDLDSHKDKDESSSQHLILPRHDMLVGKVIQLVADSLLTRVLAPVNGGMPLPPEIEGGIDGVLAIAKDLARACMSCSYHTPVKTFESLVAVILRVALRLLKEVSGVDQEIEGEAAGESHRWISSIASFSRWFVKLKGGLGLQDSRSGGKRTSSFSTILLLASKLDRRLQASDKFNFGALPKPEKRRKRKRRSRDDSEFFLRRAVKRRKRLSVVSPPTGNSYIDRMVRLHPNEDDQGDTFADLADFIASDDEEADLRDATEEEKRILKSIPMY